MKLKWCNYCSGFGL